MSVRTRTAVLFSLVVCLLTFSASGSNPAPTLTSISPATGSPEGGTAVTLSGSNFLSGATVTFGGTAASDVVVVNSTTITATTPAEAAGPVTVTVTNTDSQSATLIVNVRPVTNPGFELVSSGWNWNGSGTAAVVNNSSEAHSGNYFLQLTSPAGDHPSYSALLTSSGSVWSQQFLPVTPGDTITFGGWIALLSGNGDTRWVLEVTDSNQANATYVTTANASSSTWTFFQQTYTVPAGKAFVRLYCEITKNTEQAQANFDDAILLQQTPVGGYTYQVAPPSLTSISPIFGPINGGTSVTLTGANFQNGATVKFGNAAASAVSFVNSTTITATSPAQALGAVAVVVTNPDGQISPIQPLTNPGFEAGSTGWVFGDTGGSSSIVTNSSQAHSGNNFAQLTSAAGNHPVLGAVLASGNSQYLPVNPGDVITFGGWVARVAGNGSAQWVLQVTDADKDNPIYVPAGSAAGSTWTRYLKTYNVPAGYAFVRLYAEIYDNTVEAEANFDDAVLQRTVDTSVLNYITAPSLSWIGPDFGPASSANSVTIYGTNFYPGATVSVNGTAATNVTVVNSTSLTATTPALSAGTVNVTVTNPDDLVGTPSLPYTFNPPPMITSVSPATGPLTGGSGITISGSNFLPGAILTLGGTSPLNVFVSPSSITATTVAHAAGQVNVVVENPDGQTATDTAAYDYVQPPPSITALTPASGSTSGGTSVVISGANFLSSPTVTFGGTSATVTSASATMITVSTPASASTGAVSVTVVNSDSQSSTLTNGFTYVSPGPTPTVTSLSSTSGPTAGGQSVTITGTNFVSGATVAFGTTAATNVTFVSSTSITATTPPNGPGVVNVTVTNPDGQFATLFGMISPLPNPSFELGAVDWLFTGSGTAVVTNNPANAEAGNEYATLTSNASGSATYFATDSSGSNEYFPVVAGDVISFGGGVFRLAGDGQANYELVVTDSSKNTLTTVTTTPNNSTNSVWANLLGTYTVPSGAAFVKFGAEIVSNTVSAQANFDVAVLQRMPAGAGYTYVGVSSPGSFTRNYNNMRTGANTNETILTPANVNSTQFGKLFTYPVDGWIHAQPLYVANVAIGGGTHNVVYVATEHDSVYAFDADGAQTTPYWQTSFINTAAGITSIPTGDLVPSGINQPEFGIMATPVIDPVAGTIFVLARTLENGSYVQRLHALNITTGAERTGSPVLVQASVAGTGSGSSGGQLAYSSFYENVRPGMLLVNGNVYFGSASLEDLGPYHGWVFAYNAQTLSQSGVFNVTPNGWAGGIWQGGGGINADAAGNVFVQIGNGTFDANLGGQDYGDSILKLQLSADGLNVVDSFTPHDQNTLRVQDLDISSGGAVLLPDQPGPHVHELVGGGKEGTLYVLDRDAMGGYNASEDSQIVQELPGALTATTETTDAGLWSTPIYWNNLIIIVPRQDVMKVWELQNGQLTGPIYEGTTTLVWTDASISSNGNYNPILWMVRNNGSAFLQALNPYDVTQEYYDSNQAAGSRDVPCPFSKFMVPVVENGKVYIGGETTGTGCQNSELTVYGLLP